MGIQDHSAHWACLVEHDEMLFENWLPTVTYNGKPVDQREAGQLAIGETVGLVGPEEAPLATLVLITGMPDEDGASRHVGVSAYPYAVDGARHRLVVREITPWEGNMEGWVTASVPHSEVTFTFFDTRFYANHQRYVVGEEAEFLLAGLAYGTYVDDRQALDLGSRMLQLKGAAMLVHHDEADPDDYDFLAPVQSSEPAAMGPFPLTRVTVTLLRPPCEDDIDRDLVIPLYVPERCWRGEERPRPGDDLSGMLWLQGRLAE